MSTPIRPKKLYCARHFKTDNKSSTLYILSEKQMDFALHYKRHKFIYTATLGIVVKFCT